MSSLRLSPHAEAPISAISTTPAIAAESLTEGAGSRTDGRISGLAQLLFERRVHRTHPDLKESLWTSANVMTVARLGIATGVLLIAIVERSMFLLIVGLTASWLLDIGDGLLARWRRRETVIGAQLDILADRATAMWVVLGVVLFTHATPLSVCAAAAVWIQLAFFDQLLAGQFLRFEHWSPDEFHLEDQAVWRLNWAPGAKLLGNLPLGLLLVGDPGRWGALGIALLLIVVRVLSYLRIRRRIEQRVTIRGYYDRAADEAYIRVDGHDQSAFGGDHLQVIDDGSGQVIGIRYSNASSCLPAELLGLLPGASQRSPEPPAHADGRPSPLTVSRASMDPVDRGAVHA